MRKKPPQTALPDLIKDASFHALSQMLDPLLHLMLETGITVRELTHLIRSKSAICAAEYVGSISGQRNKSQIAIITGLPRSEVARALKRRDFSPVEGHGQNLRAQVMSGWFDDPAFLDRYGDPAILPIYGQRKSLEKLVKKHGGGIPTRAMLDELIRVGLIQQLADQKVRALRRIPVPKDLSEQSIAIAGERGKKLLQTLIRNAKNAEPRLFEVVASAEIVSIEGQEIARRDIQVQGERFIRRVEDGFQQLEEANIEAAANPRADAVSRIGVAVVYFEESNRMIGATEAEPTSDRRKNLRRKRLVSN